MAFFTQVLTSLRHQCLLHQWLPHQCHLCGLSMPLQQMTNSSGLWCQDCIELFNTHHHHCQRCGLIIPTHNDYCGQCLTKPPAWDKIFCLGDYKAPIKHYIHAFKYQRQFYYAQPLAQLLAQQITQPAPVLIPVPLHWRRRFTRGFNQSEYLAHYLAKHFNRHQRVNIQVNRHLFSRIKATQPQQGLSESARRTNIKQAYRLNQTPNIEHVALIDDVVTTGSTIAPLCDLLHQAGVKRIDVYCLCRTSLH